MDPTLPPPGPADSPDMGAMPPGGPPPGGSGPTDFAAQLEAELPIPERPYSPKVVKALCKQLEETWATVREFLPSLPELPPDLLDEKAYTGEGKLPLQVIVPALVLLTAIAESAPGIGDRYQVDPALLVDDNAVKKLTAQLDVLAADKKVRKAMEQIEAPPPKPEKPAKGAKMEPPPIPKGVEAGL